MTEEICAQVCDKNYIVEYNHFGYEKVIKGKLLHYCSGNIVFLTEDGIYHLKYQDITYMAPIKGVIYKKEIKNDA